MFSRLSKRSKKTPVREEDGLARKSISGTTKVVEVTKGKAAQQQQHQKQQLKQEQQEQTTKVLQDVRVLVPPVRVAVEDVGMSQYVMLCHVWQVMPCLASHVKLSPRECGCFFAVLVLRI